MSEKKADDQSTSPNYKISHNEQVGRYLTSTKNLEPGEQIFTELPFVVGPKASTYPLCLSCYTPWPPSDDDKPLCSKCDWPVCNDVCALQPQHRDNECKLFAESREKFNVESALSDDQANVGVPQLECVTPLRLLLESERNADRWNAEVKVMEAHNDKRRQRSQWKSDQVNVVEFLRQRLKMDRFSEECIQTACGILEINAHEVRTVKGFLARALYPKVSIMSHSCVSNTIHSIVPTDFRVYLRTTIKVSANAELYGSYTHSLLPTLLRREHLQESKYFACACSRCSDPTELDTHMSSLKCQKCDNGVVLALDSLDSESQWKCTHCEFTTNAQAVLKIFRIIQAEMDQVEAYTAADGPDAVQLRESYMKKYRSVFHPRHALLTIPRYSLSQLYGRVEDYLHDDMPDIVLEHKIEICHLLLQVLDKIEPGFTRSRGMTLYELHAPLLFVAKTQWDAELGDKTKIKSKMIEAASALKEAENILRREPEGTPEAEIAGAAKQALVQLEKSISELEV